VAPGRAVSALPAPCTPFPPTERVGHCGGRGGTLSEEVTRVETERIQQAVRDHLRERDVPGRYQALLAAADPAAISFRKSRAFSTCHLHSVTYINRRGWAMTALLRTRSDGVGSCRVEPMGGGGADGPVPPRPWLNLTGGFSAYEFAAGGEVVGLGSEAGYRVLFTFANGVTAEDTIEEGIVLLCAPEHVVPPARVEIFDRHGIVLASYHEFEGFSALA
jgi:hypothetical protein